MATTTVKVIQNIFRPCNSRSPQASESREKLISRGAPDFKAEQKEFRNGTSCARHHGTKGFFVIRKGRDRKVVARESYDWKGQTSDNTTAPMLKSAQKSYRPVQSRDRMEPMTLDYNYAPIPLPTLTVKNAGIGGSKFIEVVEPTTDFPRFPYIGFVTQSS